MILVHASCSAMRIELSTMRTMSSSGMSYDTKAWRFGKRHKEIMFTGTSGAYVPPEAILGVAAPKIDRRRARSWSCRDGVVRRPSR